MRLQCHSAGNESNGADSGESAPSDHRMAGWGLCEDLSGLREGGDRERGEERERGGEAVEFGHCRVSLNSVLNF